MTKETLREIAALACLNFTEEEEDNILREIQPLLKIAAALKDENLNEPLELPFDEAVLRADIVSPSIPREELLSRAAVTEAGCFVV